MEEPPRKREPIFVYGGLVRLAYWLLVIVAASWFASVLWQFFDSIVPPVH